MKKYLKLLKMINKLSDFKVKNFYRCIFLKTIDCLSTNIDLKKGVPSFQQSIFKGKCDFESGVLFKKEINNSNFEDCIFLGEASFKPSTFKKVKDEDIILPYISFSGSAFLDNADFM